MLIPATLSAILLCFAWWWLIRAYRQLNTAKFKIIGEFESRLPASPFWAAEWHELGEGKDFRKHTPLSVIETVVPVIFALLYVIAAIVAIE